VGLGQLYCSLCALSGYHRVPSSFWLFFSLLLLQIPIKGGCTGPHQDIRTPDNRQARKVGPYDPGDGQIKTVSCSVLSPTQEITRLANPIPLLSLSFSFNKESERIRTDRPDSPCKVGRAKPWSGWGLTAWIQLSQSPPVCQPMGSGAACIRPSFCQSTGNINISGGETACALSGRSSRDEDRPISESIETLMLRGAVLYEGEPRPEQKCAP